MTRTGRLTFSLAFLLCAALGSSQTKDPLQGHREVLQRLLEVGLRNGESLALLKELTAKAPHRLSGSRGAEVAVALTRDMMARRGFDNVRLEEVMVPHWERGTTESAAAILSDGRRIPLSVCALGGSIATQPGGVTAEVIEVKSFDQLEQLGPAAKGKIVFFNRPMDPTTLNTFEAYGGAVNQRSEGAQRAAKAGAVAALVRSMTLSLDDAPHTGGMSYAEGVKKVPAAAISTLGADTLGSLLKKGKKVRLRLVLSGRTYPEKLSANVVGELTGTEKPDEVIVVSGHLDAWDKGSGAHDDGSGCMQAIEAVTLLKKIGVKPKRTIRAVMFINEENGLRGGRAYASDPRRAKEKHIALVESDRGGFAPRGITIDGDSTVLPTVLRWKPLFDAIDCGRIIPGFGGVDISPLVGKGIPGFGLDPENHRYFDYHHSDNDTLDKVNQRELELGAIAEALLCYLIAEEGL